MYKLGVPMADGATGLDGMLTHLLIEGGGIMMYSFQPRGLNPETGEPVDSFWIDPTRVVRGTEIPELYLGRDLLGTEVEDTASGFKGVVVSTVLHINGCLHVDVQPQGVLAKTNTRVKPHNFDIRRLKGARVPQLTEDQLAKSHAATPSPEAVSRWLD